MNKKIKAFTLAEVLITLVIIGVIAAMTVPSLMNNTNGQEFKSALKKSISALNQALGLSYALEGTTAQDYKTGVEITNMFKHRMNVMTVHSQTNGLNLIPAAYAVYPSYDFDDDAGSEAGETFTNTDVCGGNNVWTTTDGVIFCVSDNYSSDVSDDDNSICNSSNTIPCSSDGNANIFIDVNGLKKPNRLTTNSSRPRDIYQAMIYAQRVIPHGQPTQEVMYDKQAVLNNNSNNNNNSSPGEPSPYPD